MGKIIKFALIAAACVCFSAFICVLAATLLIGTVVSFLVPLCLLVVFALIWLVLSLIPFIKKLIGFKIAVICVCAAVAAAILLF